MSPARRRPGSAGADRPEVRAGRIGDLAVLLDEAPGVAELETRCRRRRRGCRARRATPRGGGQLASASPGVPHVRAIRYLAGADAAPTVSTTAASTNASHAIRRDPRPAPVPDMPNLRLLSQLDRRSWCDNPVRRSELVRRISRWRRCRWRWPPWTRSPKPRAGCRSCGAPARCPFIGQRAGSSWSMLRSDAALICRRRAARSGARAPPASGSRPACRAGPPSAVGNGHRRQRTTACAAPRRPPPGVPSAS